VINDFLSFEGFVDMSYTHTDSDVAGATNTFGLNQVEISWLFDFDPVTAQIDFAHLGSDNATYTNVPFSGNTGVEQAFATYNLDNGGAVTAGMYASMLGFEAFEPTGLYQNSFWSSFFTDAVTTPGYAQGVKYTYEAEGTFFGISLQDFSTGNFAAPNTLGGSVIGAEGYGIEVAGALTLADGLTWFLGAAYEDADNGFSGDAYVLNTYVSYETGAWVFAAELNYGEASPDAVGVSDTDGYSGLLMANFAYSDQASVTGRFSYYDTSDVGGVAGFDSDGYAYTLAHNYAFTDNLLLVNEITYAEEELNGADNDLLFGAVELIFSF